MTDQEMKDSYIEDNRYKTKYPLFILIIILMFNGFIFSQEKEKDKNKISFEPTESYKSKSDKKIPHPAKISPEGKYYYIKDGKESISCFKITKGKKDEKLWTYTTVDEIKEFNFDPKDSGRMYILTGKGLMKGDHLKGNFTYIEKFKTINNYVRAPEGEAMALIKGKDLIFKNSETDHVLRRISNAHNKKITFFVFISEERLITIGEDNIIKIWDTTRGKAIINRKIHPGHIQVFKLTFNKKYLLVGTSLPSDVKERSKLKIIDTKDLSIIAEIDYAADSIYNLLIFADNKFAAVVKYDDTFDIFNLENGYIMGPFRGKPYRILEFNQSEKTLTLETNKRKIKKFLIRRGIVMETSGPKFVGEKYTINTHTSPIMIKRGKVIKTVVLDFHMDDPPMSDAISSFFRNRISNYPGINLVERDEKNKIVEEQGLKKSGITSPEEAVKIGNALNVQKLIMGELSRNGSTLIATVFVFNVKNSIIEGGREVECKNFALENLPEIVDILLSILIER